MLMVIIYHNYSSSTGFAPAPTPSAWFSWGIIALILVKIVVFHLSNGIIWLNWKLNYQFSTIIQQMPSRSSS